MSRTSGSWTSPAASSEARVLFLGRLVAERDKQTVAGLAGSSFRTSPGSNERPSRVGDPDRHLRGIGLGESGYGARDLGAREFGVPDRDAVAPPELAADAPVTLLGQPGRDKSRRSGHDRDGRSGAGRSGRPSPRGRRRWRPGPTRRARNSLPVPRAAEDAAFDVAHPDEPLLGEVGLDRRLGPVGMADLDLAVLDATRGARAP